MSAIAAAGGVGGKNRCAVRSFRSWPDHHVSGGSGIGRRVRLWQLVRWLPRSAGEQEHQRQADPGQHGAGQEGRLVALGQRGERVRAVICGQVVLGAGDGNGRDDGDAERCAGLKGGVAQARGEPGLVLGDPRERSSAPIAGLLGKAQPGPGRGQRHDRDRAVQEHHEKRAA